MVLFDPKGPVGESERFVILAALGLMLIVLIPVFVMAIWFPLAYRDSNTKATYMPKWSHSTIIDVFMWGVPLAIVAVLAVLAWTRTHSLDPYKPIPSAHKPINIEVVSMDWKWLFIYPDENIATVNEITFPVNVPVSFKLTSETVMASFFIPQLGSQIYAMAGCQTRLHLMADEPGTYMGHNQQLTGRGFANMHFKVHAVSRKEFQSWVHKIRQSPEKLDMDRYAKLAEPNDGYFPVTYFASVTPNLFEHIRRRFHPHVGMDHGHMSKGPVSTHEGTAVSEEN